MTTHIQRSALLPYPAQFLYDLVTDLLAEDPHRTSRQIQFGKLLPDG